MHKYTNALIHETSPYLLQHAHNPVNWVAWSDDILQKAKEENKLLIISIGYSACHWCHVMEKESFEDLIVAGLMNDHFIPVKVDREERPDVDDIYMTACQLTSQRGCGWPLNAFAMPDGRPIWAGTYFPKEHWINILDQFIQLKNKHPEKLEEAARQLTQRIQSYELVASPENESSAAMDDIHLWVQKILGEIDFAEGGRKGHPKFPMPVIYELLLHYHFVTGNPMALEAVTVTLEKMAYGGIFDQIGGGFARYSVDDIWLVPHFEKMLYDNGQLLSLYANAYKITQSPLYKKVIELTIECMEREFLDESTGAYYSALDADSEGEEGKFYVWNKEEIHKIIKNTNHEEIFCTYYNVTDEGNWEGNNILYHNRANFKRHYPDISDNELEMILEACRSQLLQYRNTRVRPGLDDKILSSWNGLIIKGLTDAYTATGKIKYLQLAERAASFVCDRQMSDEGRLFRNFKGGNSTINAFLEDYAAVIEALITLYQATFNKKWLFAAEKLTRYSVEHFYNEESGLFYFTSDLDTVIVTRKTEITDNVIPASNSVMARNLHILSIIFYNEQWDSMAKKMLGAVYEQISTARDPSYYANWIRLALELVSSAHEVAICGDNAFAIRDALQKKYLPNLILAGSATEGEDIPMLQNRFVPDETNIYVCKDHICQKPVHTLEEILEQIV